ncbi:hypothetical protein AVEN_155854-1 [Araneus ventricosus]|uniref:Uncharacterized protein n=1 Tax=Araneus ventricosus TaxID=182803 RepID=A0A4Y2NAY7_ARAVE|nr:hypothetical protein AVEN_155854-1 [Araneus ventricosus]
MLKVRRKWTVARDEHNFGPLPWSRTCLDFRQNVVNTPAYFSIAPFFLPAEDGLLLKQTLDMVSWCCDAYRASLLCDLGLVVWSRLRYRRVQPRNTIPLKISRVCGCGRQKKSWWKPTFTEILLVMDRKVVEGGRTRIGSSPEGIRGCNRISEHSEKGEQSGINYEGRRMIEYVPSDKGALLPPSHKKALLEWEMEFYILSGGFCLNTTEERHFREENLCISLEEGLSGFSWANLDVTGFGNRVFG